MPISPYEAQWESEEHKRRTAEEERLRRQQQDKETLQYLAEHLDDDLRKASGEYPYAESAFPTSYVICERLAAQFRAAGWRVTIASARMPWKNVRYRRGKRVVVSRGVYYENEYKVIVSDFRDAKHKNAEELYESLLSFIQNLFGRSNAKRKHFDDEL